MGCCDGECVTWESRGSWITAGSNGEWNSCCEVKHPSGKQVELLKALSFMKMQWDAVTCDNNVSELVLRSAHFRPLKSVMCCIHLMFNFTPSPHCTSHIILISSPSRSLSVRFVICFGAHFGRWRSRSPHLNVISLLSSLDSSCPEVARTGIFPSLTEY